MWDSDSHSPLLPPLLPLLLQGYNYTTQSTPSSSFIITYHPRGRRRRRRRR